ncbi:unnamed protein product [Psylliodes chrysocephalus]|uniref:F-box domain-containing protein n=1 Tax=Psylliodes chrysocephalus TaxID=3402493 RepID=A0A9P0CQJ7_9CUCU|nr:unnamed protein product [Psylliodes chrysocephala]
MFRLLPVIVASCFELVPLPMEMWSNVLRLLDPMTLLSTVRASPKWKNVCLGDRILKKKLKSASNIEVKLAKESICNPGKFVSVSRTEPKIMFGMNVAKKISRKPNPIASDPIQIILKENLKNRLENRVVKNTKKFVSCRI